MKIINNFFSWVKRVFSSAPDASYGRIISTAAFIVFVITHYLILINPYKLFSNTDFIGKFTDYLFYLTLAGYSITALKEFLLILANKLGIKLPPPGDIDDK